mgnify:CR=1 FL=1
MIEEDEILNELGGDDAVVGDDEEDELGGDGLPKVPGEEVEGEEESDLEV